MAFEGRVRRLVTVRRPHLPHSLDGAAVVHATNPATIPPVRDGPSLVVTIYDLAFQDQPEAFPSTWLRMHRRGLSIARDEATAILVPSEHVADRVREAGVEGDRVHVTPLAGRPTQLPVPTLPAEAIVASLGIEGPYVLSVGTFEPRKNQARLVRAYRKAVGTGDLPHTLVLAGHPGWRTDDLDAAISQADAGRVVGRERRLPGARRPVPRRRRDGLRRPERRLRHAGPEAMARRSPVVASSTTSIPEVAGDAAFLVDPTDEDAIADALTRVLSDEALVHDLRARGLERAKGFTWTRTAAETERVYRLVAGPSGAPLNAAVVALR